MSENQSDVGDVTLLRLLNENGGRQVSEDAAAEFYARYMEKLMSLVERNLASRFSGRVSPEDIVQSVFKSWFAGAKDGRIKPSSKDEVWKLLSVVALNKVRNKIKFHSTRGRSVSRTESGDDVLDHVPAPTPEDAAEFMDMVEVVSSRLDEMGRRTLELILEGRGNDEIAEIIGRTSRSVTRYRTEIGEALKTFLTQES
ncbi:MAG: hypothetical protein JNL58_17150 [Planctomyces sp.]|nr:hypothetical protein [Planctomyces sp.]